MNAMLAGIIGGWELVLILAVVLVLFGAKKLPELAKGLGQGIKEFKKATRDVSDELQSAMEDTPAPPRRYQNYVEPPPATPSVPTPPSTPATPGAAAPATHTGPETKII
jgi:sec-independent protein translocase protein TatA